MTTGMTFQTKVHFRSGSHGRKQLESREAPPLAVVGRVPRISRMMALAIRFDTLIRSGAVRDQAELARLGHVSRARVTQIMTLLQLAPDIQEELLFLPRIERGTEPILEREVRVVGLALDWRAQRKQWARLKTGKLS